MSSMSAHTHQPYICQINGKLVTSASSFGRLITDIDLRIDHQTKDIVSATAHNVIVTRDVAKDADGDGDHQQVRRPLGPDRESRRRLVRRPTSAGRQPCRRVGARRRDRRRTAGLDFADRLRRRGRRLHESGRDQGRPDLQRPCSATSPAPVTYNQLFTVQPFNNVMTVKTMTGDMIYRLLEQQFTPAPTGSCRCRTGSRTHGRRRRCRT